MKKITLYLAGLFAILTLTSGCGQSRSIPVAERQQLIRDMESETLQKLYQQDTTAKEKIKKAAGYGIFANGNVNVIFVSVGSGYGVVVDNSTGRRTYMKMGLGGLGFGLGVKDYRQVLIFKSKYVLDKFVESGWEFGGHADAAAKAGQSGGAAGAEGAVGSDIEAYSMTESGLALQATVTGAKYWQDPDLN